MGQPNLETLLGWKGDAEHLAHLAKEWCALLGIEPRAELSVRLVRDYAQRGILGRPRRDGKVAIYDWEHLVCLWQRDGSYEMVGLCRKFQKNLL